MTDDGHRRNETEDSSPGTSLGENDGQRFDRLPQTAAGRDVAGRPSRQAVIEFWADRYGIPPETFEGYTFWEKGAGKIWAYAGVACDPASLEALGLMVLRTRQEHWKPTTDGVQRFGRHATRNVLTLSGDQARRFLRGADQAVPWDGEWGYLIVAHDLVDDREPIGVGLYLRGKLRSQVPKGRRRDL